MNLITKILLESEEDDLFQPRRIEGRLAQEKARIEREILVRKTEIEKRLAQRKEKLTQGVKIVGDNISLTEQEKNIIAEYISSLDIEDYLDIKEFLGKLFYIKEVGTSNQWLNTLHNLDYIDIIFKDVKLNYIKTHKITNKNLKKITKLVGNKNLVPSTIIVGKSKISKPYTIPGVNAVQERISSASWWNVEQIQNILQLKWIDGFMYYVDQAGAWDKKHGKIKIGSGFALKGVDKKGNEYVYDRRTTANPGAGQSHLRSKFKVMKVSEALNSTKEEIATILGY